MIKVSKYCNLRCDYCYEFPHLGEKARMSVSNVRRLFENIKCCIQELAIEEADIIWHGGEPFLIPLNFYEQVAEIEKEVFGTGLKYINSVQTNLTILTDRHIEFLKTGFFTDIGISFDVYGDQRIDTKGRLRTDIVLANLQKLIDHKINFGAIAVLARNTLSKVKAIYRFFDALHITYRMNAYYRTTGSEQAMRHGVNYDELVSAYIAVFHEWLASETATVVQPIGDYVDYAVNHVTGARDNRFDRSARERVLIIDVDGDAYNVVESYKPEFCYGNLFRSSLSEIIASDARCRSIALSNERMQRFCEQCPYFGACPGVFVANATDVEQGLLDVRGCPVRAVIGHIVGVFERTDLTEFILKTQRGNSMAQAHPALSVV